jgi:hypothetical protein
MKIVTRQMVDILLRRMGCPMPTHSIHTAAGGEIAAGIRDYADAARIAQETADRLGELVYLTGPGVSVDPFYGNDIGEEFAPQ